MRTFDNTKYKIPQLWKDTLTNEYTIDVLKFSQLHTTNCNNFEKFIINTLAHVPKLYDLYNFKGVTYTNSSPTPAANYDFDGLGYTFNLPVWGYRVEKDADPVTISGGSTPWTFLATVSIIHTRVNYKDLPDEYIKKARIISYLYTENNDPLPSLEVDVTNFGEDNKITTDFGNFYRWIKVDDGYVLDFYAFWLYSTEQGVDPSSPIQLKTNVYFIAKDLGNELQPNIISVA